MEAAKPVSFDDLPKEDFVKFSLSESKLNTSFCNNFAAVLLKRFNGYRRAKKRVFTEIILPSAFMIFGVWISSIDFSFRSDNKLLTPSLYPLKQKLLMNENIYDIENSSLSPLIFAENLPEYDDSFDIIWKSEKQGKTFDDFGDDVFQLGVDNGS